MAFVEALLYLCLAGRALCSRDLRRRVRDPLTPPVSRRGSHPSFPHPQPFKVNRGLGC